MATAHTDTAEPVDLEVLVDLEQQFYDAGYEDGLQHGKIHGRIEGRELGRGKGFEMWEELGFYMGFARAWTAVSERRQNSDSRVLHNAGLLLELVAQFPMENPAHGDAAEEVDIARLFNQIRSRYKMLCSLIGVKPSLRISQAARQSESSPAGAEGKGKTNIWRVDNAGRPGTVDYSF